MSDASEQFQNFSNAPANAPPEASNPLNSFVTKVPQVDQSDDPNQQDLHKQHFVQTVQALQFIQNNIRIVEPEEMQDLIYDLPLPLNPESKSNIFQFLITFFDI